ncbi:MAG: SRPBCC family protein [Alphaproteobacteria bacterium]
MDRDVIYEHQIDASLEKTWAVVSDFGSLLDWVVGGDEGTISLSGDGIGMVRDLTLPSVGAVQHRLDALDHDQHLLTYSLTAGRPLGMAAYSVSARLTKSGSNRCMIRWVGHFEPTAGADADQMAQGLQNAYQDLSERLNTLITDS